VSHSFFASVVKVRNSSYHQLDIWPATAVHWHLMVEQWSLYLPLKCCHYWHLIPVNILLLIELANQQRFRVQMFMTVNKRATARICNRFPDMIHRANNFLSADNVIIYQTRWIGLNEILRLPCSVLSQNNCTGLVLSYLIVNHKD